MANGRELGEQLALLREIQRILELLHGRPDVYDDLIVLADLEEIDEGRPFPEELF